MCSSTRGPAITPSRVTCPIRSTEVPVDLAWRTRLAVDSRSCVTAPGAASTFATDIVWIESITSTRAPVSAVASRMRSSAVSATSLSPSVPTPSRRARSATWRTDSSPVAYSTAWSRASAAAHCRSSVDLPMPGSPPISVTDPGTRPPPSTRSNSAKPVAMRVSGSVTSCAIAAGPLAAGCLAPAGCRARAPRRRARACSTRRRTGTGRSTVVHRHRRTSRRKPCGAWPSGQSGTGKRRC